MTKAPLLMIFRQKNGRRRLLVENEGADESSVPFHYKLRGLLRDMEVIDASGNFYSHVEVKMQGIDWRLYLSAGLLGPIIALCSLLFGSIMVRIRFIFKEPAASMSLDEIKETVSNAIHANPNFYTYSPPDEIILRVKRARTVTSLIRDIVKD